MKKTLKIILFSSLVGVALAGIFFFSIKEKAEAKNKPILYAYQVGVFKNKENASNYKKRYPWGKIIYDGEYYRIYIGITVDNQELLSSIFDKENYSYYIKELEAKDEVIKEIKKYDTLLVDCSEENQMAIIKNMLESYENEL